MTATETSGSPDISTRRKRYRVQARASEWGNADGTSVAIVKLYGGTRGSIALDYSEVPRLIAELARLLHDHQHPARKEGQP